jgi:hypothetical protein
MKYVLDASFGIKWVMNKIDSRQSIEASIRRTKTSYSLRDFSSAMHVA